MEFNDTLGDLMTAVGTGLMLGVVRERMHAGQQIQAAGTRTHTLVSLLGCLSWMLGLPVFIAFGRKYRKQEINAEGNVVTRRYVDFTLNCDERTVDGFYYATVLKYFRKLLKNPEVLDVPPAEIINDID